DGNAIGNTISDANGDPIADRHAQSDAAATPDTVSAPNTIAQGCNPIYGARERNSRVPAGAPTRSTFGRLRVDRLLRRR
ncbi:MAG TPA: hypothetical protein VFH87_04215, partial [Candidatus Udaeobacter sp.]|nr:hypothetical protein [Candidatus Udaeobacter sp.]